MDKMDKKSGLHLAPRNLYMICNKTIVWNRGNNPIYLQFSPVENGLFRTMGADTLHPMQPKMTMFNVTLFLPGAAL